MSAKRIVLSAGIIVAAVLLIGLTAQQILAAPANAPASQSGTEVSVCTWQGCKSGAVSYSIDDGNTFCRTELEAAGFRGTYYYNGTSTQPWFATFSAAGHEIGSHLANHVLNCAIPPSCFPNCTPQSLWQTPYTITDVTTFRQNQIEPNITVIEAGTGKPVVSMAYPCGSTDAGRMTASQYYFVGARGYYDPWDSNLPWTYDVNQSTPVEFMNLNSDTYFHSSFVDRAINEGAWEIVTMHEDVCDGISYISSRRDSLWVAPVGDVLKYIRVRNAAQFSNYSRADRTIAFDAAHNLVNLERQRVDETMMAPIVYDNQVTVRAQLLSTDSVLTVEVNSIPVTFTNQTISSTQYVLFDTALNFTHHVTITLGTPTAVTLTRFDAVQAQWDFRSTLLATGGSGLFVLVAWGYYRRRLGRDAHGSPMNDQEQLNDDLRGAQSRLT